MIEETTEEEATEEEATDEEATDEEAEEAEMALDAVEWREKVESAIIWQWSV